MNIKIEDNTELIFSHAVGLTQSGKMKNTIHCGGDEIFILNMDNTILLRYESRQNFSTPFSFFANDYESPHIKLDEEHRVVFVTNQNGSRRTKICPVPKTSFEDIKKIWNKFDPIMEIHFEIMKSMISLLEEGLSHVELVKRPGDTMKLIQKDIYTGSRVEIERSSLSKGFGFDSTLSSSTEFGPIGIRTMDVMALFAFSENLIWSPQLSKNWIYIQDPSIKLSIILATCLYDELGYINNNQEE